MNDLRDHTWWENAITRTSVWIHIFAVRQGIAPTLAVVRGPQLFYRSPKTVKDLHGPIHRVHVFSTTLYGVQVMSSDYSSLRGITFDLNCQLDPVWYDTTNR